MGEKKRKKKKKKGNEEVGKFKKKRKLHPTEWTRNGFCWIGVLVDAWSLQPTKGAVPLLKCSNSLGYISTILY